jgi:hypothetical protein
MRKIKLKSKLSPASIVVSFGGQKITGWYYDEELMFGNYSLDKVFEYTKAPYELVIKESLKQAVMNMGVILDCKDIQLVPSAKYKGCFRMRPALTEEQMNMAKNYLDTYMEV